MNSHSRDPNRISKAISAVNQFFNSRISSNTNTGVWKNIIDIDVYTPLKDRIHKPVLIAQEFTSTCGPAAFWYALAYYRPELYAQAIMDLYVQGYTTLAKLNIAPNKTTLSSWTSTPYKIEAIDWIALASLKNTTSPRYDALDDAAAGITLPSEISKWLKTTDWTVNQDNASTVFTNSLNDLKLASRENTAGRAIFFFVKAKSIGSVGKGPWWGPDHWIMLTSSIQVRASAKSTWTNIEASALANTDIGTYQIQFWIYTWGFYSQIGPNNHRSTTIKVSTVNDFLDYFYGFISATPPK